MKGPRGAARLGSETLVYSAFVSDRGATVVFAAVIFFASACERTELPVICPDLEVGGLVVTEIRGPQTGADTRGQWLEVFNPTPRPVDLRGLVVRFRPLDGREEERVLVRAAPAVVEPSGYFVLGVDTRCTDGDCAVNLPPDVDYGMGDDFARDLFAEAVVEVEACGTVVDEITYRSLPGEGSRSLDGATSPDAMQNDDLDQLPWCDDQTAPGDGGPMLELGIPGTPGRANRVCP